MASELEESFAGQVRMVGLPAPMREHRFHPTRRWRLDFYWPDYLFAVEVEGGEYVTGRHMRQAGFREDAIKYAEATLLGITVMRFPGSMIEDGSALSYTERYLNGRLQRNHD